MQALLRSEIALVSKKNDLHVNLRSFRAVKSHRENTMFLNGGARTSATPPRAWFCYKEHTPPHRGWAAGRLGGGWWLVGWLAGWLAGLGSLVSI